MAGFVFGEFEPLGQAVGYGHRSLRSELKALKVAHKVVRKCITIVGVGPKALGGLLLGQTQGAPPGLELFNEAPDSVQIIAVGLVHGAQLVLVKIVMVVGVVVQV